MKLRLLSAVGVTAAVAAGAAGQRPAATPGVVILRVDLAATADPAGGQPAGPSGGYGDSGGDPRKPGGGGGGLGGPPPGSGGSGGPGLGGPASGGTAPFDPTKSVVVVVPYKNLTNRLVYPRAPGGGRNPMMKAVTTDFGTTLVYDDRTFIQSYWLKQGFSLEAALRRQHTQWLKDKPAQGGYDLVAEALSYGLTDLAVAYADETLKSLAAATAKPPVTVENFVKAYTPLAPKLSEALPENPEAARWQTTLRAAAVDQSAHYALVNWGEQSVSREGIDRRLALLESNFKAFYLWHALGGTTPKLPDRKLVVVLADKRDDLIALQAALDGNPVVADSFYSPTHNVMVMSPERLDEAGRAFTKYATSRYTAGWDRNALLKGTAPPLKASESVADVIQVMTISLVDKMVEEEATVGMVTREGTRQLYAASGVLSQHVVLPEWLEAGVASLLQKPKGPVYIQEPNKPLVMTVGLASGYGTPNYVLIRQFRDMIAKKQINPAADQLLLNTLLDNYFAAARNGQDIDPPPAPDAPQGIGGASGSGPIGGPGGPGGVSGGDPRRPGSGGSGGDPRRPGGGGMQPPPGGDGPPGVPGGSSGSSGGLAGGTETDPAAEARTLKAKLEIKAQVTAWGLSFYLSKKKMPGLLSFYAELNKMPRDMRLDRQMVLRTFTKAFALADPNDPAKLNDPAFKQFAEDWVAFLKTHPIYGIDIPVNASSDPAGGGIAPPGGFGGGSGGSGGPDGGGSGGGGGTSGS